MEQKEEFRYIRCILLTKREGDYGVYAFENVDPESKEERYIMCTRLPNWDTPDINMYQEGILSYKPVTAGIDRWFNPKDSDFYCYKYSANYFIDFVPITHIIDNGRIVERTQLIVT